MLKNVRQLTNPATSNVYTRQELDATFGLGRSSIEHMKSDHLEVTLSTFVNAAYAQLFHVPKENRFVSLIRLLDKIHEERLREFGVDEVFPDGILSEYCRIIRGQVEG